MITALLSFVVDLVGTDRRENARATTQQDMQTALNFMVDDLRQAVYVYDKVDQPRDAAGPLKNYLPDFSSLGSDVTPVLAFWKAERLPYETNQTLPSGGNCNQNPDEACQVLIRRRAYTLVVYLLARNPSNSPKWKGQYRVLRYALRKYNNLPSLTQTPGYASPVGSESSTSFMSWPVGASGWSTPSFPTGGPPVLVDFVDKPSQDAPTQNVFLSDDDKNCTSNDQTSPLYTPSGTPQTYRRIPSDTRYDNFFVCVKSLSFQSGTNQQQAVNQDVFIYLRGNPVASAQVGKKQEPLETLKTQAVARGVIDKRPQ